VLLSHKILYFNIFLGTYEKLKKKTKERIVPIPFLFCFEEWYHQILDMYHDVKVHLFRSYSHIAIRLYPILVIFNLFGIYDSENKISGKEKNVY